MGIFDFLSRRSEEKHKQALEFDRERHELKLETERRKRDLTLSVEEKKAELERIRLDYQIKEQQEALKEDFEEIIDDEEESDDTNQQLLKTFAPMIGAMINKNNPTPQSQPSTEVITPNTASSKVEGMTFTDEEIEEIYKAIPQVYKTVARTMSDQQIKDFIKTKYKDVTDECLNRMIARVKR